MELLLSNKATVRPTQQQAGKFDYPTIRQKLEKMVQENRLQHFYSSQRLDQVAQRVASQDVAGLGRQWRLPREVHCDAA